MEFKQRHPAPSLRQYVFPFAPAVRLICFPNAGAGASIYRPFSGFLPACIELLSVQLPGRGDRLGQAAYRDMEAAARDIALDIKRLPEMPTVLFGHSMGAILAFETACILGEYGIGLKSLIVSGKSAPHVAGPSNRCRADADDASMLGDLRRLGGTPAELLEDAEMRQMILQVVRADYRVLDNYQYTERAPLACPVIACAANADTEITLESVSAWERQTVGAFQQHWFEGNHFYLFSSEKMFAEKLTAWTLCSE